MNYACVCDPNSHWIGEVEMEIAEEEEMEIAAEGGWGRMLCRPESASVT